MMLNIQLSLNVSETEYFSSDGFDVFPGSLLSNVGEVGEDKVGEGWTSICESLVLYSWFIYTLSMVCRL